MQTWRVNQGDVVSFLQTSSLHQQGGHSLRPLMELQTGEGAGHCPLEEVREGKREKEGEAGSLMQVTPQHRTFTVFSTSTNHQDENPELCVFLPES